MYQAIASFSYFSFDPDPVTAIERIINEWRYNGQIIGREFGVTYHQDHFEARVAIPAQDSLLPTNNSKEVNEAMAQAEDIGVEFQSFEVVGRDYQARETSLNEKPSALVIYTTHLESCSPVYALTEAFDEMKPLPLYQLWDEAWESGLGKRLIKWQEDWQACDQLQMNGSVLEAEALAQISEIDSPLTQEGRDLADLVELITGVPTYYYLYRLGKDPEAEAKRVCPSCGGKWGVYALDLPFQFRCDKCRLLSNWSWELQG